MLTLQLRNQLLRFHILLRKEIENNLLIHVSVGRLCLCASASLRTDVLPFWLCLFSVKEYLSKKETIRMDSQRKALC